MKNRITHMVQDWEELVKLSVPPAPSPAAVAQPPKGVNMLSPVELYINRDLLVGILTDSIKEIHHHLRMNPSQGSEAAEIEAALEQQLAFRAWAREQPSVYVSIALYPVSEYQEADEPGEEDPDRA